MVYLIFELMLNPNKNSIVSAAVSRPIGYKYTKKEAETFCENGKTYTQEDCWALLTPVNQYIYKEIKEL